MIVDSSAVVAILMEEPGYEVVKTAARAADRLAMGAPTYVELSMVVDGKKNPPMSRRTDDFLADIGVEIVPFTAEHARVAREAFRDYGRGSGHRARLSYGDCCAYAVARLAREPLLFVGDGFAHTDVEPALR